MPKDTYIRIRLTAEQKEQIKKAAKRNKTNMSDFVLTATRNTIKKKKERNNMRENERICNVLNEITVEEFLEIYSKRIQDKMSELGYYVSNGLICIDQEVGE